MISGVDPNQPIANIMRDTLSHIVLAVLFVSFARWFYIHWRFWSILRDEEPFLSDELSRVPFAHIRGLGWINFALERRYRELDSKRLQEAGDAMVTAYERAGVSWAFLWLALAILFGVSLLVSS